MSFWDFVGNILPTVLPKAAATIYGAVQKSATNAAATRQANDANVQATQAQQLGLEEANRNFQVSRNDASPGLIYAQNLISRGSALTPQQEMAVADSRKVSLNALKGSSLRGSARATSAVVNDTDIRQRNDFMARNKSSADSMAGNMTTQYFNSGNNIANNAIARGDVASQGLVNVGNNVVQNTNNQGKLRGQAIGDIGAIIADQAKVGLFNERNQRAE